MGVHMCTHTLQSPFPRLENAGSSEDLEWDISPKDSFNGEQSGQPRGLSLVPVLAQHTGLQAVFSHKPFLFLVTCETLLQLPFPCLLTSSRLALFA